MRLRGSGEDILQLARAITDRYQSILQVSYDELAGNESDADGPETNWHKPGAFWYRGLWWGNTFPRKNDRGEVLKEIDQPPESKSGHGGWTSLQGRVPDPDTFFWAWIMDGDWFARDGYELWYQNAKRGLSRGEVVERNPDTNRGGNARHFIKTLVYAITAHDYFFNFTLLGYEDPSDFYDLATSIRKIGFDLISHPLNQTATGPLWHPEWLNRFIDFLMIYDNNHDIPEKHRNVSRVLNYVVNYYNSNFIQYNTLAMAVIMTDIANNKYDFFANFYNSPLPYDVFLLNVKNAIKLIDHFYFIADLSRKICKRNDKWHGFGIGDGEMRDSMLKLQWGTFLRCLRAADITESQLPDYRYAGHYPVSSSLPSISCFPRELQIMSCNEVLIRKMNPGPILLSLKFSPNQLNLASSFSTREIWIVGPSGSKRFLSIPHEENISAEAYPNVVLRIPSNPKGLGALQSLIPTVFDSYSGPHQVHDFNTNWQESVAFLAETGSEDYTVQDTFESSETGIFKIFIRGKSVIAGMTRDNLHETMILRNVPGRNYIFSNCRLFIRNLENDAGSLSFWASVEVAIHLHDPHRPTVLETGRSAYGSFARVSIYNANSPNEELDSRDLKFSFDPTRPTETQYGEGGETLSVPLPAGSMLIIAVLLLYPSTVVRMITNCDLFCARSESDIRAFEGVDVR